MAADGFATRRGRRGALIHRDEVHGRLRGRRGARLLALTSGGAIPEVADYRVVLEPDDTFIGTLNEDFAIESMAGDVFQLGNTSWRVLQVASGTVRVADARVRRRIFRSGSARRRRAATSCRAPSAISARRSTRGWPRRRRRRAGLATSTSRVAARLDPAEAGIDRVAAEQAVAYLADARRTLGVLPTQDTLVLERFFDESGGMQLVLHAPFGSRINKAWGLALRKRFCRQFNFELQAAATEDALLLSLGPQHSFPLADVFRYLHPATARDVLVQAFLDAPVFQTRWRWNTTISLAVPRNRDGRKVPPQLQRMHGRRSDGGGVPRCGRLPGEHSWRPADSRSSARRADGPRLPATRRWTSRGWRAVLARIHAGELRLVSRDTPEPSVARARNPECAAVRVPRRCAARRAAGAGGLHPPIGEPAAAERRGRARRRGDRTRAGRGPSRPARRRRAARRAADGGIPDRRGRAPMCASGCFER